MLKNNDATANCPRPQHRTTHELLSEIDVLKKENESLSKNYAWCNEEMLKMDRAIRAHPTCKTCLYHINASEIGNVTCQRWEIETHGGTFYCKDHEAKEVGEL